MESTPHRQTWELYAKGCTTTDEHDRRMLLEQSVDAACVYTDPMQQCLGLDEFIAMLLRFQRAYPGNTFRTTRFVEHTGRALADWEQVDGEGNVVVTGTSYTRRGEGGRLVEMTGFFPTPG